MEKKTSEVSLSFWQAVVAMRRSHNSSRILSRYQDGGECRDNPSIPYHLVNSLLPTGCIFGGEQEDPNVVEEHPSFVVGVRAEISSPAGRRNTGRPPASHTCMPTDRVVQQAVARMFSGLDRL